MTLDLEIKENQKALKNWLFENCLPLWAENGLDLKNGGFYEQLNQDLTPNNINRRTRVAARQIYSYALARKMGYRGDCSPVINHGIEYLNSMCLGENGYLYAVLGPSCEIIRADFDLYDHAFYLLGLASAYSDNQCNSDYKTIAEAMRDKIINQYWRKLNGFEEAIPPILPLKANPHMHMFEACLAWIEAGGDEKWRELADKIARLAVSKFYNEANAAIFEFFDENWQPSEKVGERTIEPGHQFEWAWLFIRWSKIVNEKDYLAIAKKLIETGENFGVDAKRNLAFMSHNDKKIPIDFTARLWSQTERIKAHVAASFAASNDNDCLHYRQRAQSAVLGLMQYLKTPIKGLYYDRIDEKGAIVKEPSPTSSLYHIICAIDEFCKL